MDLKNQILVALGLDKKEEQITLSFQAKLEDGTIIASEDDVLAEGSAVSVLAEDGSLLPLPAGDYRTEDGLAIVCDEDGVVASVSQEEVSEEDETAEEVAEEEVAMEDEAELTEEVEAEEVTEEVEVSEPVQDEPVATTPKSITTTTSTTEEVKFDKETFLSEINDSIEALKNEIVSLKSDNADLTAKLSDAAATPLNLNKHSNDAIILGGGNKYLNKFNNLNK